MDQEIVINGFRLDGRRPEEIRKLNITTQIVEKASGSCYIQAGGTQILAWIQGPKEGRSKNAENVGSLKVEFTISQSAYPYIKSELKKDLQMREFSSTLKEIFEEIILLKQYPKSDIEINAVVLQNDGSYKTLTITAITMALINAGVFIKDTAVGISLGLQSNDIMGSNVVTSSLTQKLVDLTKDEENSKIPVVNACYLPNHKKIVYMEIQNSTLDFSKSENLIYHTDKIADSVYSEIKSFLLSDYSQKSLNTNNNKDKTKTKDNKMLIEN